MHSFRTLLPGLFLLLTAGLAHGLDDSAINNWLDSMEALQAWAEDEGIEDDPIADGHPGQDDFEQMLAQAAREHPGAKRIIRANGFSGAEDWAGTGARIMSAWMAVEMERENPQMEEQMRQMEQQVEQMKNDPNIPQQQRDMMVQQMEQARSMMHAMTEGVPDEDKAAVKRNRDRLGSVMEQPGDDHPHQGPGPGQQPPMPPR